MGHVQNPPASKSTQSNSLNTYRSRVKVRGINDSKKYMKNKIYSKIFLNKLINDKNIKFHRVDFERVDFDSIPYFCTRNFLQKLQYHKVK